MSKASFIRTKRGGFTLSRYLTENRLPRTLIIKKRWREKRSSKQLDKAGGRLPQSAGAEDSRRATGFGIKPAITDRFYQ